MIMKLRTGRGAYILSSWNHNVCCGPKLIPGCLDPADTPLSTTVNKKNAEDLAFQLYEKSAEVSFPCDKWKTRLMSRRYPDSYDRTILASNPYRNVFYNKGDKIAKKFYIF